jgi:hypothetical protein
MQLARRANRPEWADGRKGTWLRCPDCFVESSVCDLILALLLFLVVDMRFQISVHSHRVT